MANCTTELFSLIIRDLPSWVTVLLTGVIAGATIAYVLLTKKLWQETKKSADAATTSAEAARKSADATAEAALAAKKSAEVAAALHRPFVGLLGVKLKTGWGTRLWDIAFTVKNYGTLPALNVGATIEFFTDNTSRGIKTEPSSVQIFPSEEPETVVRFDMGDPDQVPIHQETKKLQIKVRIPYQAEDGRHFEYTAEVSYTQARFLVDKSETH